MKRFSVSLRTAGNHHTVKPLRPYGGSSHMTVSETVELVAGITGHAKTTLTTKVDALHGPESFRSIKRPGLTVTIVRER